MKWKRETIIPRHNPVVDRQLSEIDEICPLAIANQISIISKQKFG